MKNYLILCLNTRKRLSPLCVYLIEVVQCLVQISIHSSWRLIDDLDGVLQYSLWDEVVFGGGGGFSADKHPEVFVTSLCVLL